jgi:hypothetical protein
VLDRGGGGADDVEQRGHLPAGVVDLAAQQDLQVLGLPPDSRVRSGSVLVVVSFVGGVTMGAVQVVDVVAVLDLIVATALAVGMGVLLGLQVLLLGALVVVAFVGVMDLAVM